MKERFFFSYCLYGKWHTTQRRDTRKEAWRDMYTIAEQHQDATFIPMTLTCERYTPVQNTESAQ